MARPGESGLDITICHGYNATRTRMRRVNGDPGKKPAESVFVAAGTTKVAARPKNDGFMTGVVELNAVNRPHFGIKVGATGGFA